MKILFVHQNFPGQFKFLAPELCKLGHDVAVMTMNNFDGKSFDIDVYAYKPSRGSSNNIHPWVGDFETKVIRGQAAYLKALDMRSSGYHPDVIIAHPGWGESMFLKDVWPKAKLGIYCEFFYHADGADVGFDPEFPDLDSYGAGKIRLKNVNNLIHMDIADAGLSPTSWQSSTFPQHFQNKITVVHDGIDTTLLKPYQSAKLGINLNGKNIVLKKDDEVITFVNRNLEPYRGYHTFCRALPEILKRRTNAQVLIVGGDGVSYGAAPPNNFKWKEIFWNEVVEQLNEQEKNRVHFLGSIPYQHFLTLLQISSVHVYLTYPFVLSWSLMEAMSVGCAIVGSSTQPVKEVIRDQENGLLVDFFNHQELADKVIFLLENKEFAQLLGVHARRDVQKEYDLVSVCLPKQIRWVTDLGNLS